MSFKRPEHDVIVDFLHRMDSQILANNKCYFGGGTAIVLKYGEYRKSLDVDFLCHSVDGYRELRTAVTISGPKILFGPDIELARDPVMDGYGIRMFLKHQDQPIKFEIVKEANIEVTGSLDEKLGVPTLSSESMFATKLLANADRWIDPGSSYRDAVDIGMLLRSLGQIPHSSMEQAIHAYGEPAIQKGLVGAANALSTPKSIYNVRKAMDMDKSELIQSVIQIRNEVARLYSTDYLLEMESPLKEEFEFEESFGMQAEIHDHDVKTPQCPKNKS